MNRFNHKTLELAEHHPECLSTKNYSNLTVKSESEVAGGQFHLVMQQIGLGLPVEPFLKEYPQINNWVDKVKPFLNILGNKQWSAQIQYLYHDILLYSECDLIIYGENQVVGFDWTIQKPLKFEILESKWQTQLRLFLLHEKTGMPLEQISLVYLFINTDSIYQFTYSEKKHLAFKERLEETLAPFIGDNNEKKHLADKITPQEAHDKWLAREISTTEYLAAIPEVEL
ncbi:hypothetical protein [Nostoc sp.]